VTSSAFVHHVVRVQPSAGGYEVTATLTGLAGSGAGAKARLFAYIAGAANDSPQQRVVQSVTTGDVTLTVTVPPVSSVSTLAMDAGVLAQPTSAGEGATASASATVTKITLRPLGG